MSHIYPSLEDFKYDILMNSKHPAASNIGTHLRGIGGGGGLLSDQYGNGGQLQMATTKYAPHANGQLYPSLSNSPNYPQLRVHLDSSGVQPSHLNSPVAYPSLHQQQQQQHHHINKTTTIMVAPLSGYSQAAKLQPSNAIRPVIICKDSNGKVGLRVGAVQGGIFVVIVHSSSPAAMAGLKFGDQILEINGISVAGYSMVKVHDLIKRASPDELRFAIRDRPFERSVTLHKDQNGLVGFIFNKLGRIVSINRDSSAARNGLLVDHNIIEINAQNVVGMDELEIKSILDNCGDVVILTILPSKIFEQMIEQTDPKLFKKTMDHSSPE